jgi:hypothetical protein
LYLCSCIIDFKGGRIRPSLWWIFRNKQLRELKWILKYLSHYFGFRHPFQSSFPTTVKLFLYYV